MMFFCLKKNVIVYQKEGKHNEFHPHNHELSHI